MPNQGDDVPDRMLDALDALDARDTPPSSAALVDRLLAAEKRIDALEALLPLVQALTAQRKRRKPHTNLDR